MARVGYGTDSIFQGGKRMVDVAGRCESLLF